MRQFESKTTLNNYVRSVQNSERVTAKNDIGCAQGFTLWAIFCRPERVGALARARRKFEAKPAHGVPSHCEGLNTARTLPTGACIVDKLYN
jgi:hypothetical protein